MPNWCSNAIMIQGEPEEVGKLLEFVEGDGREFSFNKIIVMPPQLLGQSAPAKEDVAEENIKLYGSKDWYDWANKHWGTKWNASDVTVIYDDTSPMMPGHRTVRMEFETAWAPPMPVYSVLAKQFPNTNIYVTYNEPGVGFSGWALYKGGELFKEQEYDISPDNMLYYLNADKEIFAEVS